MPVCFLSYASSFVLFSALEVILSMRTTVEICAKTSLQQDASISLGWEGMRRVRGNSLFAGHFFVFLPTLGFFSMSWENNCIRTTREKHVFL